MCTGLNRGKVQHLTLLCDIITLCPRPRISIGPGHQKIRLEKLSRDVFGNFYRHNSSIIPNSFHGQRLPYMVMSVILNQIVSIKKKVTHGYLFYDAQAVGHLKKGDGQKVIPLICSQRVTSSGPLSCSRPLTYPSTDWGRGSYPQLAHQHQHHPCRQRILCYSKKDYIG